VTTVRPVEIRVVGHDLPGLSCGPSPVRPDGHRGVHVAVQRRGKPGELFGLTPGDAAEARWVLPATADDAKGDVDLKGPYIQGARGARFVYLSWVVVDDSGACAMFRRAKLMFDGIPSTILSEAVANGVLVGRLGLTDEKGNPSCASMRPPLIEWSAGQRSS
jgi:hypothetical protein